MQLNLRKASALQREVKSTLNNIKLNSIRNFDDSFTAEEEFHKYSGKWRVNYQRIVQLRDLLYRIRDLVGLENAQCGVNRLLAQDQALSENEKLVLKLLERCQIYKRYDLEHILQKLKIFDSQADLSISERTVTHLFVSGEEEMELQRELLEIKRERRRIQDQLLELNLSVKITLSAEDQQLLESEGIL